MALAVVAAGLGGWVGYLRLTGNFHAVIPGELYRAAQLDRVGFEQAIARHGIRTVINLRGANPGTPWYDDELAATAAAGVGHVDLRLSARRLPGAAELDAVRATLAVATPPILIHCQAGADRAGLVAALYMLWIAHRPPDQAGAQLSLAYGHFPWFGSRTAAMDEAWRGVLAERRQSP